MLPPHLPRREPEEETRGLCAQRIPWPVPSEGRGDLDAIGRAVRSRARAGGEEAPGATWLAGSTEAEARARRR